VTVHPTQLYEAAALGILLVLLLRWRSRGVADAAVLGRYFVLAGTIRFFIEFIRLGDEIAGPLTLAQLISMTLVAMGLVLLVKSPSWTPSTSPRSKRTALR
jgi:phosphatidylglycerol:prolipoprotein diacylglycerol transferase